MDRKPYFQMAQEGDTLDVVIFGDITSWPWYESEVSAYNIHSLINQSDAANIHVRINSYGGEVAEGLAIYNTLKNHPAKVTTECMGFACSAASIVFEAGDERVMDPASLLMIHNAWTYTSGNAKQLRKEADDLDKISNAAAAAYKAVMTISDEELDSLLDNESWITPEEAVTYGFATRIQDLDDATHPLQSARQIVYGRMTSAAEPVRQAIQIDPDKIRQAADDAAVLAYLREIGLVAPVQPPVSHVRKIFKNMIKGKEIKKT